MRRYVVLLLIGLPLFAEAAVAQGAVRNRPGVLRPNRRLPAPGGEQAGEQPTVRRQQVELQIRRTFWRVAKQRIGFSDEQMGRLERTSQRFDERRRQLAQQERTLRISLRSEILADSSANQATIATTLDQMHGIQRQRLDLQVDEQKELSAFMTPLQRAKFGVLQEQVRRRIQELLRNRPDSVARPGLP